VRLITVKMPEEYLEALENMVRDGRFRSVSEAVRFAVRQFVLQETLLEVAISDRRRVRAGSDAAPPR
jgi:Arc/MetJ-type ribon-helix-helix transcriptional regulator